MRPDRPVLRRGEYVVEPAPLDMCLDLVGAYHYAQHGANTAVFRHGLFARDCHMRCRGAALWLPPTKSAALAWWPQNWQAVLSLSRLVVDPEIPQNGASFLLARSMRLVAQDPRWECLVTYADEAQGHTGAIYLATGWEPCGWTKPERRWVDARGRMVSRKAGPRTRTAAEMLGLGYRLDGSSRKRRFRKVIRTRRPVGGCAMATSCYDGQTTGDGPRRGGTIDMDFWDSICRNEDCDSCGGSSVVSLPLGCSPEDREDEDNCYCGDPARACDSCSALHEEGSYPA